MKYLLNGRKKEMTIYLFRKKIIGLILSLLLLFSAITTMLFFKMEKNIYLTNIINSNDSVISQIASFYEFCIQNVKDISNKSAMYDIQLLAQKLEGSSSVESKTEVLNFLTSLSVMNEYVHSSYLYFPNDNLVYTSFPLPSTVCSLELFQDSEIFSYLPKINSTILNPRLLPVNLPNLNIQNQPLVITVITTIPLKYYNKTSYLIINIDAKKLYSTVFSELKIKDQLNFYITDSEQHIIYHKDPRLLFTAINSEKTQADTIISQKHSPVFGWDFILETKIPPIKSTTIEFLLFVVGCLVGLLLVSFLVVGYCTIPVKKMMQVAKNTRWKDFILSSSEAVGAKIDDLKFNIDILTNSNFVVCSFRATDRQAHDLFLDQAFVFLSDYGSQMLFEFQLVDVSHNTVVVVLGFPQQKTDNYTQIIKNILLILNNLLDSLPFECSEQIQCGVSNLKNNSSFLHEGYLESIETFDYSYTLCKQVKMYRDIATISKDYEFPSQYSRQLLNNLVVGNLEACLLFCDKIFESFRSDDYIMSNSKIIQQVYLIQNEILTHLMSLPIPIKIENPHDYNACQSIGQLSELFKGFLKVIVDKINSIDHNNRTVVYSAVLNFIDDNFCQNDICLNMIAEKLSMNTNYISKIIKEMTGKNFSEYITYRRIERSKELLKANEMTVNQIAESVGYTYTYYFIRKFKESEGITPGQYSQNTPS